MLTSTLASIPSPGWILGALVLVAVVVTAAFYFVSRLGDPDRFNPEDPAAEDREEQP